MGVMSAYLKWGENIVPEGIRRPFLFFRCLYALDMEDWKTAEKVASEADVPIGTAMSYLKIAHAYGLVERKSVPSSAFFGDKVYAYRLSQSHFRFKGVQR